MTVVLGWIAIMLVGGTWWVRRDVAAYAHFQTLSDTAGRQRLYRRWLIESLGVFVGASVVSLWLAAALAPFEGFPEAFIPTHRLLQPPHGAGASSGHWVQLAIGLSIGIGISTAVQWHRIRRLLKPQGGADAALIPRNRSEGMLALLLSLNAGFSEELFFRLALPLLLLQVTGSVAIAFALSTVAFGLAHAHYGWKGVLATTAAGALLTLDYLSHGSLVRVMIAHAVIDVLAFFVRPAVADWLIARKTPGWIAPSPRQAGTCPRGLA